MERKSTPRHSGTTIMASTWASSRMCPISRSRYTGMIGFCTAPRRAKATMTTRVSMAVGSTHETSTPRSIPTDASRSATPTVCAANPEQLMRLPCSSTRRIWSGDSAALSVDQLDKALDVHQIARSSCTSRRVSDRSTMAPTVGGAFLHLRVGMPRISTSPVSKRGPRVVSPAVASAMDPPVWCAPVASAVAFTALAVVSRAALSGLTTQPAPQCTESRLELWSLHGPPLRFQLEGDRGVHVSDAVDRRGSSP